MFPSKCEPLLLPLLPGGRCIFCYSSTTLVELRDSKKLRSQPWTQHGFYDVNTQHGYDMTSTLRNNKSLKSRICWHGFIICLCFDICTYIINIRVPRWLCYILLKFNGLSTCIAISWTSIGRWRKNWKNNKELDSLVATNGFYLQMMTIQHVIKACTSEQL